MVFAHMTCTNYSNLQLKNMVEFLSSHTPELRSPSEELRSLAEQVRSLLAGYSPDQFVQILGHGVDALKNNSIKAFTASQTGGQCVHCIYVQIPVWKRYSLFQRFCGRKM